MEWWSSLMTMHVRWLGRMVSRLARESMVSIIGGYQGQYDSANTLIRYCRCRAATKAAVENSVTSINVCLAIFCSASRPRDVCGSLCKDFYPHQVKAQAKESNRPEVCLYSTPFALLCLPSTLWFRSLGLPVGTHCRHFG